MQGIYLYFIGTFLLLVALGMGDAVAQSPPATNYENSGVVSEMIGSDAAGRVAYTDEVVAEFGTPEVQARVNAAARQLRTQLRQDDFLLASKEPSVGTEGSRLHAWMKHLTGEIETTPRALVQMMQRKGIPEQQTRALVQDVSGIVAGPVDATLLVRAVRSYNAVVESASNAYRSSPSEDIRTVRGVLAALVEAVVQAKPPDQIHAGSVQQEDLSPIQLPREQQGLKVQTPLIFPSTTIATPTAYGARWGQVYGSGSYQPLSRYYTLAESDWKRGIWADGTISFGAGLGNPHRWVGVDLTLNLLDTFGMWSTDGFADERSLSVKVHRAMPASASIAIGYENVWQNSASGSEGGNSVYAVASKTFAISNRATTPLSQLYVSLGLGSDRFLSESSFQKRKNGINVFGSIAVRVMPFLTAITEWTGQDMNLGFSLRPYSGLPVTITPAVVDLTGRAGDRPRFSIGVATTYDFRR